MDGWDWKNEEAQVSLGRLFERSLDRGVILLHDGPLQSFILLDLIPKYIKSEGGNIVSVSPNDTTRMWNRDD